MKKRVLFFFILILSLSFGLSFFHQAKLQVIQHDAQESTGGYMQPPCVYFDGRLYYVRPRLFEKDVGDPSTWNVVGQIVSSCGYENIPTQNGEINFDISRLIEPVIYII